MISRRGFVLKCVGGLYSVLSDGETIRCFAKGKFRKEQFAPTAGDFVTLENDGAAFVLAGVERRKNYLIRPFVANIDRVLLVCSVREPEFNAYLLDKMLAVCKCRGIDCAIVITKSDLDDAAEFVKLYGAIGYPCISLCGKDADEARALEGVLVRGVNLLCGNSGVGKTTLLNSFAGLEGKTAEISTALGRGKHTTREAELHQVSDGVFVCDTAGFSSVSIEQMTPDMTEASLAQAYPEFAAAAEQCRFADCRHVNEPGCAVLEAVADGRIAKSRYSSYLEMRNELKSIKKY